MPAEGLATFVSGSVNDALTTFVTNTSAAISAGLAPLVVIGMTIWATTYGLAVMRNEVQDPIMGFVKNVTKVSIILGIALSAGVYQSLIIEGVNAFTSWFIDIVAPGGDGNIFTVIDEFDAKVSRLGAIIIGRGMTFLPVAGWLDILAGLIVLLGSAVMILILIGLSIMATVAMKFMLAIGPVFIVSLCFPPIAKFFDAWLGKVMNYSFLLVGLAVVTTMSLVVVDAYVSHFLVNQTATTAMSDAIGLIVVEGALGILIWQMPSIASGLGGGASLSGGGLGAFVGGMIAGRMGGEDKPKSPPPDKGGGSIEEKSGGGNGGGGGRTPAYRRATLDRLQNRFDDTDR